jgi:hypothetical protein
MNGMFAFATAFNNGNPPGVSGVMNWNTSQVTDMSYMFWGANRFNQDISRKIGTETGWVNSPTSNNYWYTGCVGRANQTPAGASPSGLCPNNAPTCVTGTACMANMFASATLFNQNLRAPAMPNAGWCVSQFASTPLNFAQNATAWNSSNQPLFNGTQCPTP